MILRNPLLVLSAGLLVACQGEVAAQSTGTGTGTASGTSPTPTTQSYLLDFSKGSFTIGYRRTYWLGFDFSQPVQSYVQPAGSDGKIAPNVAMLIPVGEYCQASLSAPAEIYADLKPGESGWVDHVDVDMTPPAPTDGPDLCFGYLDPAGTWHWELAPVKPTWDAARGRLHMTFTVQKGPLAGFAILSGQSAANHLEDIVITARKGSP